MTEFSNAEKQAAFDRIAECFFHQNFGTISKPDIDLLMFSIYADHIRRTGECKDDYSISKTLGITQQRVRNLKVKYHLRYGEDEDWKLCLAEAARSQPHFCDNDKLIVLSFDDPIVMIEVQHFIEQKGGFVDFSFNPKLLRMTVRDFAALIAEVAFSYNEAETLKRLQRIYRQEKELTEVITKEKVMRSIKNAGTELLKNTIDTAVTTILSYGMGTLLG